MTHNPSQTSVEFTETIHSLEQENTGGFPVDGTDYDRLKDFTNDYITEPVMEGDSDERDMYFEWMATELDQGPDDVDRIMNHVVGNDWKEYEHSNEHVAQLMRHIETPQDVDGSYWKKSFTHISHAAEHMRSMVNTYGANKVDAEHYERIESLAGDDPVEERSNAFDDNSLSSAEHSEPGDARLMREHTRATPAEVATLVQSGLADRVLSPRETFERLRDLRPPARQPMVQFEEKKEDEDAPPPWDGDNQTAAVARKTIQYLTNPLQKIESGYRARWAPRAFKTLAEIFVGFNERMGRQYSDEAPLRRALQQWGDIITDQGIDIESVMRHFSRSERRNLGELFLSGSGKVERAADQHRQPPSVLTMHTPQRSRVTMEVETEVVSRMRAESPPVTPVRNRMQQQRLFIGPASGQRPSTDTFVGHRGSGPPSPPPHPGYVSPVHAHRGRTAPPALPDTPARIRALRIRSNTRYSYPFTHWVGGTPTVYDPNPHYRDRAKVYDNLARRQRRLAHRTPQTTKQIGDFVTIQQNDRRFHIEIKPNLPTRSANRVAAIIWVHAQKVRGAILTELINGIERSHGPIKSIGKAKLRKIIQAAKNGATFIVQSDLKGGSLFSSPPLTSDFWTSSRLAGILSR